MNNTLYLTPLTEQCLNLKTKWLNNERANEYLYGNDPKPENVTLEDQEKWYREYSINKSKKFWIVQNEIEPIGLVGLTRINPENKSADIFILIGEDKYRGKGLCLPILELLTDKAITEHLKKLTLSVSQLNKPAIHCYLKFGFKITKEENGEVAMEKILL